MVVDTLSVEVVDVVVGTLSLEVDMVGVGQNLVVSFADILFVLAVWCFV